MPLLFGRRPLPLDVVVMHADSVIGFWLEVWVVLFVVSVLLCCRLCCCGVFSVVCVCVFSSVFLYF